MTIKPRPQLIFRLKCKRVRLLGRGSLFAYKKAYYFLHNIIMFLNISRRFASFAIMIAVFGFATSSYAQTATPRGSIPQIHIIDLALNNNNLESGGVVSGVFTLFNNSTNNAPDVSYSVFLVGEYKDNQPTVVYDEQKLGQAFLAVGEKKTISFNYNLPSTVSGNDLAIRIQAMYAGFYLGWDDVRISVAGTSSLLNVASSSIEIGGVSYGAELGAVVPKGGTVGFKVSFSNPGTELITFTPNVRMYNRISTGELLNEFKSDSVTVSSKSTKTIVIPLPTFDYKPLVYAGDVSFLDEASQPKASVATFRYMILGDMASIQTVTSESQSGSKGDVVNVDVLYGGAPLDQGTGEAPKVGIVDVKVTLFDGVGNKVGENTAKLDLDKFGNKITVPVSLSASASSLKAVASIEKNGSVLATESNTLTKADSSQANVNPASFNMAWAGIYALFILLIIIFITITIRRSRGSKMNIASTLPPMSGVQTDKKENTTPPNIGGTTALLVLLAASFFGLASFPHSAEAYIETYVKTMSDPIAFPQEYPALFINSPYDNQVIAAGSTFYIDGRQDFWNCSNESRFDSTIKIGFNGATTTETFSHEQRGTSSITTNTFNYGPFTAPMVPGKYRIFFRADTIAYGIDPVTGGVDLTQTWVGSSEGYVDIIVSPPLPAPTVTASTSAPTSGAGGVCVGAINVSWTSVPGTTSYSLYRDGGASPVYTGGNTSFTDSSLTPGSAHSYRVVATSPSGNSAPSNQASANASTCPTLSASCLPSPTSATTGSTVTWNSSISGGVSPYTYVWSGSDSLTGNGPAVSKVYNTAGSKTASVNVSSSDGQTTGVRACTTAVTVSEPALSSITCAPSKASILLGESVTWTANPVPFSNSYTYSWSGDESLSGTARTIVKTYTSVGIKTARVDVIGVGTSPDCVGTVKVADPTIEEF
ncbi:MAG: hypothetical protein A2836_02715 [Candidatus Taylorbacteria bacterium RIFCSPHIGHO2_01_FULL_45_63]|uniref:Fibronectin type-III domain-containing protein n=1 Tax=Candidatus Taylorbacteria bacterium RIFCSPHIGHO2_02_FULL_45_35 TaxID=1802311 RepID=A0A1G2MP67_9BACT|nr:MAG: hypothetical protein A2836_02715 [Candidatus Taylorbacteria bacterium RIFCSPHIGHO2_01_FULL_45_63]OHA25695.1 MAG: hypothetical protein A3D56_00790 [Candidatus Taylorbacteria bacterium RIFCSPHIGHO2_02_FULL_45_35]